MSDVEEPPNKMSKYEEYLEESDAENYFDEGQEEWLSEEMLTDDEYNVTDNKNDPTLNEVNQNSMSSNQETVNQTLKNGIEKDESNSNIENTLNNLHGKNDLPDDLDAFLIRKTDNTLVEVKIKEDNTIKKDNEEDDGNDTDDLLRLLEGGQHIQKKTLKMVRPQRTDDQETTDDDEFIYDHSKVKTLKIAKNALIKRVPTKAEPENMSDSDDDQTDASTGSATMKRMFDIKEQPQNVSKYNNKKIVSHTKVLSHTRDTSNKDSTSRDIHRTKKPVVQVKQHNDKQPPKKGILKTNKTKSETRPFKSVEIKSPTQVKISELSKSQKPPVSRDLSEEKEMESDEIIDGEEFLEEDDFELDEEEFDEESEGENSRKQRIMRPEMMDEEVPSDDESNSEEGSIYDELPSSDSEDFDDWFTLDIRAETASDYLPLLGGCARSLLTAEKQRAADRVASLRTSLSALTESARRQADSLRSAAMALAEIDDTLRAA